VKRAEIVVELKKREEIIPQVYYNYILSDTTIIGHVKKVTACKFAPDRSTILSASEDGSLMLWDARTGTELRTMQKHKGKVTACAFSPDGTSIVSSSADKRLIIWDARTGKSLREFIGHVDEVTKCASIDGHVSIWDARKGSLLRDSKYASPLLSCAYSTDGTRVVSVAHDGRVRIYDPTTLKELLSFVAHLDIIWACAFSPDGTKVLTGSHDNALKLWDASTGRLLRTMTGHTIGINACEFSPDGKVIISASSDSNLKLWDVETGKELCMLVGHVGMVNACAFSSDGAMVVSASDDYTLKLWDVAKALAHPIRPARTRPTTSPEARPARDEAITKEKLVKAFKVSTRIQIQMLQTYLRMDEVEFTDKLFDWAAEFGFKIDGDSITIENADITGFMTSLDKYFADWNTKEKKKAGKME
jgi:WD40 repeat protein